MRNTICNAFGLKIFSDFELPELPCINTNQDTADVVVMKADLTSVWSQLASANERFVVKPKLIMFHVPKVAIYLIKNGDEIFVSPIEGSDADQVRLYILGTCMGAILLQRKIFPLHGSAVVIDNEAYAVIGHSGAGKSTLASAFLKRGFDLLSDDVIPVTLSDEGIPFVTPAYPQQKLWLESLEQFDMSAELLRPIIGREAKFSVPISTQFVTEQIPLVGVIELLKTDNSEIEISPIQSIERLHTLFYHTYRNFFIERMGLLDWHFNTCAKVVSSIQMFRLTRPPDRFTAHELVDVILTNINRKEITV